MRNKYILIAGFLLFSLGLHAQQTPNYKADFDFFCQTVGDNYCYFEKKQVNWAKVIQIYSLQIDTVSTRTSFISILENCLYELYDHHCSLGTRNKYSRRLVPTGADMWAEYQNGIPIIREVRKDFGAAKAGITSGMEVIAINDVPVVEAAAPFLGHTVNFESRSFALRLALAGDHITKRKITLRYNGKTEDYFPDQNGLMLEDIRYPAQVESKLFGTIGYIRINNFLFDNTIIVRFDSILNTRLKTKSLIIDLRETASGGNTTVARAILGRFIKADQYYQKHELYAEEKETGIKRSWVEIVSPRLPTYTGKVVVLVDHWTGSVAEGMTIAFDGMKRATVIGTDMARLNGAIQTFQMPETHINFNIATERLYHVNGTPREIFRPDHSVNTKVLPDKGDVILNEALRFLGHENN